MPSIAPDESTRRLLWNDPAVIAFCALAVVVTVAIIASQMHLRTGVFDPTSVAIFNRLFLFQDYPGSLLFVVALLIGLTPVMQRAALTLSRWLGAHAPQVALVVFSSLAVGSRWVYQMHPVAMDEFAPLMQSEVFAAGRLLGRFPSELVDWLVFPGFQGHFLFVSHETGEVASAYWPGFAMILTPFTALGLPWICNPALGAASILVIHRLVLQLTQSADAAGAAILFTIASVAFTINAISFYSMTAHLLCNALFVLLLLKLKPIRVFVAGLVGGLALNLHNPVPHLLFAAPWVIWLVCRRDRYHFVTALIAGYLPWVVIGFGWHDVVQGLARNTGEAMLAMTADPLSDVTQSLKVLALPGVALAKVRVIGLAKLWLWAAPSIVLLAAIGFWRWRRNRCFQLLACSVVVTLVGYLFVPADQGHGWGYRYFHSAWFVLPVVAAAAFSRPGVATIPSGDYSDNRSVYSYSLGAALCGLLVMTPYYLWNVNTFISAHLAQLPTSDQGEPRLVIVNPYLGYYAQDLVQNDPFLRESVIHMITHGRRNDEEMVARNYPDLVLLSKSFRGSVWGHSGRTATGTSGIVDARVNDKRKEK